MAIWPGNKNKRHTIQVSPDEAAALQTSLEPTPEPTLGRKPSRRASKRQQNSRLSRNGDATDSTGPARSSSQRQRPMSLIDHRSSQMSSDRADDGPPRPLSRTESLMRSKNQNGPNKLRRRLSKRKAHEIMREREIRMLCSTPIDIPRPTGHPDYNMMDHRRRKPNGRRIERYQSDVSLSFRDSAASSFSDLTDPYTFKVNAFAALTPRPVVRYVEAPRAPTARSNQPVSGRSDKDRLHALPTSEEDLYHSKRRMNELADSLDASTLRELMERDRRRREKKQIEDQEKLRRKLQARADAQQAEEERAAQEAVAAARESAAAEAAAVEHEELEPTVEDNMEDVIMEEEEREEQEEQEEPKESDALGTESLDESARVVGNIDDSSIRDSIRDVPKLATRPSFAPSHDMGMSRTTLSPSHSSVRHGFNSPSHSQTFGMGSNSDLSERRLSDASGRRGNAISSLFRRGSSRLKRRYRERFQESSPEVSNASHESFYRIQTQSSPPPTSSIISPRTFLPTGTVMRSQSKFTEHFGDEPMSPPDSRLQSPDIPEEVTESSLENNEGTFLRGPTPSASVDIINPRRRHHQSWAESVDADSENVPLSQSLASIDSEGSWMSGQFFRRMNQPPGSPVRPNISSIGPPNLDGAADIDERISIDSRGASSNVMREPELDNDLTTSDAGKPAEMWHSEVGRRPVVVNPISRPKSTQGALRCIPSLSPISAEEDYSPVSPLEEEGESNFPHRIASVHGEIDHV
ncbi:uncharacterized protein N7483_010587 [Penicillium malachiteum]|uniref:uncharacterized protein n=1 Tax=Penicillium malachiteum TaxID=1324776 RepID=UPI002547E3D3|nr:uncharacterized protein N7483_010587 [Penicillium malachiteum]KAJ5713406.1 hypothetical protein N7483_010587 [Penicillium malachiteum]